MLLFVGVESNAFLEVRQRKVSDASLLHPHMRLWVICCFSAKTPDKFALIVNRMLMAKRASLPAQPQTIDRINRRLGPSARSLKEDTKLIGVLRRGRSHLISFDNKVPFFQHSDKCREVRLRLVALSRQSKHRLQTLIGSDGLHQVLCSYEMIVR